LVQSIAVAAQRTTGIRFVAERVYTANTSRQAAFDGIENALRRLRVPLLLCRGGHYTVVRGITESSLILLDSGGACWISKRACGVPGDGCGLKHVIYPASFMALTL
jgi:hypothetical protein